MALKWEKITNIKGPMGPVGDAATLKRLKPIETGAGSEFEITDGERTAVKVHSNGDTSVGDMRFQSTKDGAFQVTDGERVAFEVDSAGRTHIYDLATADAGTGSGVSASEVTELHAFLLVGQSNMVGPGKPAGGSLDPENPRILQFGANRRRIERATVPLDMHEQYAPADRGLSPGTVFARHYVQMFPANVGVLLIPAAHGGTGFTGAAGELTWSPGKASSPDLDLPGLAVKQTNEALAAARAAGYSVSLKGMLWHQGENNSSSSESGYASAQDGLLSYLRTELHDSRLPFVAGQMVPENIELIAGRYRVDRAHQETPARVQRTGFARSKSGVYRDEDDKTHFNREGVEHLGKNYLAGYWQALGNTAGASPKPPVQVSAVKSGTTVKVQWEAGPGTATYQPRIDFHDEGLVWEWSTPSSRVTGYKVEHKTGSGSWVTINRDWDMALTETIKGVPSGTTQVRVTASNGTATAEPITVTASGA